MCEPVTAALATMKASTMFAVSLGVSAVTAGMQYIAGVQNANAQAEAQRENIKNTTEAAATNFTQQQGDLHNRESQLKASMALRLNNQRRAADRAKATAKASSESAGLSFDALTADFDRQYSEYASSELTQLGFDMEQMEATRQGLQSQAQSRINTIPRTPINRPSFLTAAASVAGSALDAYDNFSTRDPDTGLRTL